MSEPEFIPFNIDEADLLPYKRRHQTKEEALYGVFGQEASDEESYDKPVKFAFGQRRDREIRENLQSHKPDQSTQMKPENLQKLYGKGLKLMQMKGFEVGKGIGKNLQGRVEPVEIERRNKKQGLSFTKPENISSKPTKLATPSWAKKKTELIIEPKRSIQEVRDDLQEMIISQPSVLTSITDMRSGKPVKVVDFSMLNDPQNPDQVREAEAQELMQMERKCQTDKDTLVALEYEEQMLQESIEKSSSLLLQQEAALDYLEDLNWFDLDATELLVILKTFEFNWPVIADDFRLRDKYALKLGKEAFSRLWKGWRFEEEPLRGFQASKLWTEWLSNIASSIFEPWVVQVVLFISARWNPLRKLGELDNDLKQWKSILPLTIWSSVESAIQGKLQRELEAWDPRKAKVSLHIWIHPWLSLVDLSELWQILVPKLGNVLTHWHPADPSAYKFLKPWAHVLGTYWESLLKRHILPKLVQVLHECPLDSAECEMLDYVFIWLDIFPSGVLFSAFQSEFYPRWYTHLKSKLIETDYDLASVETWYTAWQQRVPILDLSRVFVELGM